MEIYEAILHNKPTYPEVLGDSAIDLLAQLLKKNP